MEVPFLTVAAAVAADDDDNYNTVHDSDDGFDNGFNNT